MLKHEILKLTSSQFPVTVIITSDENKGKTLKSVSIRSIVKSCFAFHRYIIESDTIKIPHKEHEFMIKNIMGMVKNFCHYDEADKVQFKEVLSADCIATFTLERMNYDEFIKFQDSDTASFKNVIMVNDVVSVSRKEVDEVATADDDFHFNDVLKALKKK